MKRMFYAAIAFNQPLDQWRVANVSDFSEMFAYAICFNQHLGWCIRDNADARHMFYSAISFHWPDDVGAQVFLVHATRLIVAFFWWMYIRPNDN
jgi:hypothetical protein